VESSSDLCGFLERQGGERDSDLCGHLNNEDIGVAEPRDKFLCPAYLLLL
jgi:hypothetical protein